MQAYRQAVEKLPKELAQILLRVPQQPEAPITELRLRSGCPVAVTQRGTSLFVQRSGRLTAEAQEPLLWLTHRQLQACFIHLCHYSVFSYEEQLCRGYFTLAGGHRVGVAAVACWENGRLTQPRNVTSLAVRIARRLPLPQPELWREALRTAAACLLIAGAPASGKTTVLRSLAGLLSNDGCRVAVLDERCELFPVEPEGFGFAQPWNCDVLSGMPKALAMEQALRSLAPQVLLCDELGPGEVEGLLESLNSGVRFVATIHAATPEELWAKPQIRSLLKGNAPLRAVFLQSGRPGYIRESVDVDQSGFRHSGFSGRWSVGDAAGTRAVGAANGAAGCTAAASAAARARDGGEQPVAAGDPLRGDGWFLSGAAFSRGTGV